MAAERFGTLPGEILDTLRGLSHPTRLQIAVWLQEDGQLRFNVLKDRLNETSGNLTPHLKHMQAGAIICKVATSRGGQRLELYQLTPFGRAVLAALNSAIVGTRKGARPTTVRRHPDEWAEDVSLPACEADFGDFVVAQAIATR